MTHSTDNTSSSNSPTKDADKYTPAPPTKDRQDTAIPDEKPSKEIGGQTGPDPTRYGDWEKNGRCTDF